MWAKSGGLFTARVVFLGETPETDPAICFDTSDLRRLLLHRLEVLEAALHQLESLQSGAAKEPANRSEALDAVLQLHSSPQHPARHS